MPSEKEILLKLKDAIVNLDIDGVKKASEEATSSGIPAYKAVIDGMAKGMEIPDLEPGAIRFHYHESQDW